MSLDQRKENLKKVNNIHQELINACKINDRKAQYEIYKLYYKAMYNTAIRILGSPVEAEDVMQESFLDAFRKIGSYVEKATFGAWLKRIVINNSIDVLKGRQSFESIHDKEIEIEDEPIDENPIEILSYKTDNIRKSIESLPDRYRIILSLYLLEGYDHEEISKILNMNHGAVRTKYSRAKQKLLKELSNKSKTLL